MSDIKRAKVEGQAGQNHHVSVNNNYNFKFESQRGDEYSKQTDTVSGTVSVNDEEVGYISGHIIKRNKCGNSFYTVCDAISSELQVSSTSLFTETGVPTGILKALVSSSCYDGGYLHIEEVKINKDHRGRDLGLTLFQKLLQHFAGQWTIAIIQPFPLEADLSIGSFRQGIVSVSQYFARLGFRQVSNNDAQHENKFWYLEASTFSGSLLSKEESKQIPVALEIERKEQSVATKHINEIIEQHGETARSLGTSSAQLVDSFRQAITAAVQAGASLDDAMCLQVAAANKHNAFIVPLIELGE